LDHGVSAKRIAIVDDQIGVLAGIDGADALVDAELNGGLSVTSLSASSCERPPNLMTLEPRSSIRSGLRVIGIYGLSHDEALKLVTLNPAIQLGIEQARRLHRCRQGRRSGHLQSRSA